MEDLIAHWGYAAIVLGTFFEGETVLVLGGALARRGTLDFWLVALCAFVGSLAGDQLWFFLGRRGGRAMLARRPAWQAGAARVDAWTSRYGALFVLGFRFLYGLRTVVPVVLGASGYSPIRFVALNTAGALAWSVTITALGYGIGAAVERLVGRLVHVEEALALGLVVAALSWLAVRRLRRPRAARPPSAVGEV